MIMFRETLFGFSVGAIAALAVSSISYSLLVPAVVVFGGIGAIMNAK